MKSRFPTSRSALFLALLFLLVPASHAWATDAWPVYRGPAAGGPDGDLPDGAFGLTEAWKTSVGSGYSNVSILDGKAVTMFTAGDVDVVAAFDITNGGEVWRYELGEKYAGHSGSDDGPLGTPTLVGDGAYVLGPHGQLVALSLADGAERWRLALDESNSTVPFYGYTSTPVVTDDLVIVATGGEGHAISAYDRATGEQKWTRGDDSVTYQTPLLAELGGKSQLLAVTDTQLQGLDPSSGEILWQHRHTAAGAQREGSAHPTLVDDQTFLVKYNNRSALYRLSGDGVEEVWETRAFANTFSLPVYHDGHFYGFTGNFLTCASAETGEIVWRSRPPGGFGLSLVDGRLAIMALDGHLVIVDATPSGYQEVTRVAALDAGNYPIPSFAAGHFFVRNLEEMAAIRVDGSAAPQVAEGPGEDRFQGSFGAWAAKVEAMDEGARQAAVDERFAELTGPVIEDDGHVTFVYRGDVEDVGVGGFDNVQGDGLYRLAGTDLFFRTYELDPSGQYAYAMNIDYGPPAADPNNPHGADIGFGPVSELRMNGFTPSPFIDEPAEDAPRGQVDGFPFRSEVLENSREIQVYRPAGYGQDPEARYPLLIVNHGDNLLRAANFANTLDNLLAKGAIEPLVAVFVPRAQGPEYGGPAADGYNQFLRDELLPHVEKHYQIDTERRGIMGPGSAGVAALYASYSMPDVFDRAAAQSYYIIEPIGPKLDEMVQSAEGPDKVVVVWSHNDYELPNNVPSEEAVKALLEKMAAGDADIVIVEGHHSPGWGGWRHQHGEVLKALFPPPSDG